METITKPKKTYITSIRFTDDLEQRIRKLAKSRKWSFNQTVEYLAERGLDDEAK